MKIGEVKKWKKAVFQEEESKLVGSSDRSIDFASNIFENEYRKRAFSKKERSKSIGSRVVSLDLGNVVEPFPRWEPLPGMGCFFGGEYSSRGWTARSSGSAADE